MSHQVSISNLTWHNFTVCFRKKSKKKRQVSTKCNKWLATDYLQDNYWYQVIAVTRSQAELLEGLSQSARLFHTTKTLQATPMLPLTIPLRLKFLNLYEVKQNVFIFRLNLHFSLCGPIHILMLFDMGNYPHVKHASFHVHKKTVTLVIIRCRICYILKQMTYFVKCAQRAAKITHVVTLGKC